VHFIALSMVTKSALNGAIRWPRRQAEESALVGHYQVAKGSSMSTGGLGHCCHSLAQQHTHAVNYCTVQAVCRNGMLQLLPRHQLIDYEVTAVGRQSSGAGCMSVRHPYRQKAR
jgi:hypothetical protein